MPDSPDKGGKACVRGNLLVTGLMGIISSGHLKSRSLGGGLIIDADGSIGRLGDRRLSNRRSPGSKAGIKPIIARFRL